MRTGFLACGHSGILCAEADPEAEAAVSAAAKDAEARVAPRCKGPCNSETLHVGENS